MAQNQKWEEYVDRIHYSDRYSDDNYEYRHVILPKPLLKLIPKTYFEPDDSGSIAHLERNGVAGDWNYTEPWLGTLRSTCSRASCFVVP
ncbi:hypothetical protein RSAG8_10421, partial [Rhizoctonia solani AG-8 WAC10335]